MRRRGSSPTGVEILCTLSSLVLSWCDQILIEELLGLASTCPGIVHTTAMLLWAGVVLGADCSHGHRSQLCPHCPCGGRGWVGPSTVVS